METLIKIELVDLEFEKYTKVDYAYLELREFSVKWYVRYRADHPINQDDEALGWKEGFRCYETIIRKAEIAGVGRNYCPDTKLWQVYIEAKGFSRSLDVFYKKEKEGKELLRQLEEYLWPTDVTNDF